jgi:DNA/RNA-binding domain of Phe-tRNA-synthetase-like protein
MLFHGIGLALFPTFSFEDFEKRRYGDLKRSQKHEGPAIPEKSEKEQRMKQVTISDKCLTAYPWMKFAYCFVTNLSPTESSDYLKQKQEEVENHIRSHSEALVERAKAISRFYKTQGEKNRSHIESLIKSIANGKRIKPVNFIVDSVMIAELRNGLLLGVHDLDRIQGDILLDIATESEGFDGIGHRSIHTRKSEVVLRDDSGIWASYPQGPDARTVVDGTTKNVIILGFFTPETTRETMVQGMRDAVEVLLKTAEGEGGEITVVPF